MSTCFTLYAPQLACDSLYGSVMIGVPYGKILIAIHLSCHLLQFTPNCSKILLLLTKTSISWHFNHLKILRDEKMYNLKAAINTQNWFSTLPAHFNTLSSNPKMPASSQTHKETATDDELQVQLLETSFSLSQMNNKSTVIKHYNLGKEVFSRAR